MNIYISPHPDDAVISCGGRILKEKEKDQVVINVFCKEYSGLTNWDKISENYSDNPMKERIEEDRKILNDLDVKSFYLDFYDNAVCLDLLNKKREDSQKNQIYQELEKKLQSFSKEANIFFPSGIGHPDHLILAKIGLKMTNLKKIFFYEDLPYALFENQRQTKKGYQISSFVDKKLETILLYKTQRKALFKMIEVEDDDSFKQKIKSFHQGSDLNFFENTIIFEK